MIGKIVRKFEKRRRVAVNLGKKWETMIGMQKAIDNVAVIKG